MLPATQAILGLGAVILHEKDGKLKLIQHASRALLPAEMNYLQIEKEGLAIIFAIKKFHKYVHIRKFILQMDHRPLLAIFGSKKGIPTLTANHLPKWATMLLNHSFKMEILLSKEIIHVDGLSRLIPKNTELLEETVIASLKSEMDVKYVLFNIVKELRVTLEEIKFKTKFDKFINQTKKELMNQKVKTDNIFSKCNNILMYGEWVVIPAVLTKKILKDFHTEHSGMSRMKALMQSYVYWPSRDKNIENKVKVCKSCALVAKAPPIKFNQWPKTDKPWSHLHIDYAGLIKRTYFFVIQVSFTKWPEVFKCKTPMTKTTIKVLQELFSRFELPETIVSDNSIPFTSKEFENFCKLLLINHLKLAPYHPRSNGRVERFINVFKRAIKKANGIETENKELQEFLSIYWITPNPNTNTNMSPAELMFARKIRSIFNKLIPSKKGNKEKVNSSNKTYNPREKIYFLNYHLDKASWLEVIIE